MGMRSRSRCSSIVVSLKKTLRARIRGSLGRGLLLHVEDIMRTGKDVPMVPAGVLAQSLVEMSRKGLGMTAIVRMPGARVGIFTDGDLRRSFDRQVDVRATAWMR